MPSITDANSVDLKLKERVKGKLENPLTTDNKSNFQASIPIDDFEFSKSQDKPFQHGIGNEDPIGTTTGNAEYTASLTLLGDDANIFGRFWEDSAFPIVEMHIKMDESIYKIKGLDETDVSYSASDGGDPVELSVDFNATNITQDAA